MSRTARGLRFGAQDRHFELDFRNDATALRHAMIALETGLYLRVEEMENGPRPLPLQSGFSLRRAYRALGIYSPSETSEAYFVLSNDRDEVWFICNRHLRTHALMPAEASTSFTIREPSRETSGNEHAPAVFLPLQPGRIPLEKHNTIHKENIHGKTQGS